MQKRTVLSVLDNILSVYIPIVVVGCVLACIISWCLNNQVTSVHAQTVPGTFHVTGVGLPSSLGSPTTDEGTSLAAISVTVGQMFLTNTDTSDHTLTIQDCSSTPWKAFNGVTIRAGETWPLDFGGIRFKGCFKWTSNSTTVQGNFVGQR